MIELRDVHKHYGDYYALRGITAAIGAGEFFSLLGPSGCGKTTLLRTIAGFEPISSGAVLIDGRDMAAVPPNLRPTNMVFQSYAIFPHLSVMQNGGRNARNGWPEGFQGAQHASVVGWSEAARRLGKGSRSKAKGSVAG
jgi:spermidine/putrescine transport system ATP-binding protein